MQQRPLLRASSFFRTLTPGRRLARALVPSVLVVGSIGATGLIALTPAGASPVPSRFELSPGAGNAAFAQLRGVGYEQALLSAEKNRPGLGSTNLPSGSSPLSTWTPIGPAPEFSGGPSGNSYGGPNSGRVTGLAVTPGASPTIYLASAGGGVWRSTNNGTSWSTTTDSQPDIAMGSVTVDPTNPSYVFGGTGENNACLDCFYGAGVMESSNGGASWTTSNPGGIFTGTNISSIVVEPGASSISTTTVLVGDSSGLFVSTDGGSTWTAESNSGWVSGNVTSLVINALTSPTTIYASVFGLGVEESTDNGSTWSTVQIFTDPGNDSTENGALTIAPASTAASTVLYDSVGSDYGYVALYKSTDGGASWTAFTNCSTTNTTPTNSWSGCVPYFTSDDLGYNGYSNDTGGDQSWYDNVITVDPTNPNIIVAAGITAVESTNGGASWTNLDGGGYFVTGVTPQFHPDFHALTFDSAGDLYIGNDGGVWELSAADVATATPNFVNLNSNLDITQFYAGIGATSNGSQILAGAQDNGTNLYTSTGSPPTTWNEVVGGDGGASVIDPGNSNIQFAEEDVSLGGNLVGTTNGWSTQSNLTTPPFASTNWAPPLVVVPNTSGPTLLFGGNGVFVSSDGGSTWGSSTGYTASDVSAIAVAPSNPSVIYAGYDDGTVQMSSDGGSTWTTIDNATGDVTHLTVSATDPYTVYMSTTSGAFNGFPEGASAPAVSVGTSLATSPTWTDVSGNLPTNIPTTSVIADGSSGLIVADDAGVFWAPSLNGSSTTWRRLGGGLPNVQVVDITLTSNGTLIAETHGRGVWTLPFTTTTNAATTVCTWNGGSGASGSNWSVGANWFTTSGSSCTAPGGPPAGAQLVFPASPVSTTVTWDTGTESGGGGVAPATSYGSITFDSNVYTFVNDNSTVPLALSPGTSSSSCTAGTQVELCANFSSGVVTFPMGIVLSSSQEFAATSGATLDLTGALSDGSGVTLTVGDGTDTGVLSLAGSDANLLGPTVVAGGVLNDIGVLTGSAVTVDGGATLAGSGSLGSITNDGGVVAPGLPTGSPAQLTSAGADNLAASGTGTFAVDVTGATPGSGYSQLSVSGGSLALAGSTLSLSDSYTPSGVTSYTVVSLGSGVTETGTFNGLANDATFTSGGRTFQVTYPAESGGSASEGVVVSDISSASAPSAPTITSATANNASATLEWSIPADNGSAITGYTVSSDNVTTGALATNVCGNSTSSTALACTVTGLINGDSYTFTLAAINSVGTGSFSSPSPTVTPESGVPGAPLVNSMTPLNASVSLTWTPTTSGTSPIVGFTVTAFNETSNVTTVDACPGSTSSTSTSCTVTGLTNGDNYTFEVAAINSSGTGGFSSATEVVTPATTPGTPTITSVAGGNTAVTVSWSTPVDNGSAISGYTVSFDNTSANTSATDVCATSTSSTLTSCTVTGLINGDSYTFTVAAINGAGTGSFSAPSGVVTPAQGVIVTFIPTNAPPPAGLPAADFGTPVSGTASCSGVTTLTLTSGGATAVVTIPSCALPAGTVVSIYPILASSSLSSLLPSGTAYVSSFAVSWLTLAGTSPASNSPITMTVTDSAIAPGDTVYQLTNGALTAVATASTVGTVAVTFNSDPIFVLSVPSQVAQAPLSIVSTSGRVGSALALTTSGGSGGGALSFSVVNGTARGCTLSGASLRATSTGTCVVTATMAGDASYLPVSSSPTAVSMVLPARPGTVRVGFASGRSALTASSARALAALSRRLIAGATLTVIGFAPGNARLARARALVVARFIESRLGVHVAVRVVVKTRLNAVDAVTARQ